MEAPVSVSLGIACSLPAKLEQLLSPETDPGMRLSKGEKNKIRLVKERLQEVMGKFLMEPSDVEAPASTARCWVKEVRELSYDIDDFLDELIHGLHPAATAAKKNLRGRVAGLREGLSRSRWVSQETARFRARLEEAIERHKRYSLGNIQIPEIRIDSDEPPIPPLYGVEANNRLVGIDSSMEKLGEWLTGDGERQLRVVSIVGLGGVGKTTLAKELYCKLRRQFECRAFVRSSKKPDMRRLLTSILLQVRPQRLPNDTELGNLTGTIRAHLQDKKYLIIIDDLWAPSMWDIVCRALPDDTCCSRVLATTEIDIVAQICSGRNSKHIFKMEPLNDNESKKLFFSRFPVNQSKNNEQLFEVSSEIVRKCGGFPLATITTARLLARQHNSVEQCNCIRRSLPSNLRTDPTIEGVKHVLSLCYNNLPGHLKACMLYVSVYKEDHIIWKDDLVKQWIAQGFICVQEGKDKEEVASTYFDELVNEGMIQPVDINCIGEVLSCTVHYMVLEVIRYKSIEENFVTAIEVILYSALHCIFSTLPKWIGKLRLLGILKIQVMGLSSDDVHILEGLPALSALLLYVRTAPAEQILFLKEGFPVLKHFKFICSALCITFMKGTMPNVRRLKLGFDANTLVQHSPIDAGFEHLTGLEEISAKIGNTGADESSRMAAQSALETAFSPHRVNIKLVDWTFYGEKERSPAARKENQGILENCNPVPDGITNESSDEQYGIGENGSKKDTSKRSDNRITMSLESSDNQQEIEEIGSGEATSRQGDTRDLPNDNLSGEADSFSLSTTIRSANNPNISRPSATEPTPGASPFPPPPPYNSTASVQSPGKCSSCIGAVADGVAAGAALLFAIPAICFAWCRQQTTEDHKLLGVELDQFKRFSLKEIRVATDGFSNKNVLGRGGYGKVYKGRLPDGTLVAVNRMEEQTPRSELKFQTEVGVSSMAAHRNLLRLLGFCITQTERVIVYPYMANGSVASRLRERQRSEPPLDWQTRRRIALGSARALSYLHDQCVQRIIHRDVKASKILLDGDFEAVVGGFSLAKPMDHIVTDLTTAVRGTIGHIAPEYLSTGRISEKTDVYSYGIMLLELITGQRAFDLARLANDDDVMLLDWVKGLQKEKKLVKFIDPDIQQNCIHAEVESLFQIALLCTQHSPMDRPTMHEVVRMLVGKKTGREIGEAAEASSSKYSTRSTWECVNESSSPHLVIR